MLDESFSLKEYMEKSLAKMENGVQELKKAIDKNNEMTESVLIQATKTNGRVTAIEDWSGGAKKILEKNSEDISSLKNYRWWIIGFAVAITATGWFALEYIVHDSVETALKDSVSRIEYEK